jgi:uncharacterized membrane protein
MTHYAMVHWLFFFYIYCFLGWCFESAYVSLKSRKLVNRGFMRGPFLPLYGSGAIMMYVVSRPFQDNIILTYIAGFIGATVLEYVTGALMEHLFKVRYWDYTRYRFNIQGYICLSSSVAWGFLTIFMTRVIHKPIERFVLSIPQQVLSYVTLIITIYVVADFTLSFKAALDLRDILIKMEKAKEEMERIQRRLDVIAAFNNEEKEQKRQKREQQFRDEVAELRAKFNVYMENRAHYKESLDFYKRDMLRNNPMVSRRFKDTLEELKAAVANRKEKSAH